MYKSKRFERWFAWQVGLTREFVSEMWSEDKNTYTSYKWNVELAWDAWNAALNWTVEENDI